MTEGKGRLNRAKGKSPAHRHASVRRASVLGRVESQHELAFGNKAHLRTEVVSENVIRGIL